MKPYKTHSQAIIELLASYGDAMRGAQIISRLTRYGDYKTANLQAALYAHPRIIPVGQDTYDLRERVNKKKVTTNADELVITFGKYNHDFHAPDYRKNEKNIYPKQPDEYPEVIHKVTESDKASECTAVMKNGAESEGINKLCKIITTNLRTSYKPVLLLSILDSIDDNKYCTLESVVQKFAQFYLERKRKGLVIELKETAIAKIEKLETNEIKNIILRNPLRILQENQFIKKHEDNIYISKEIMSLLNNYDALVKLKRDIKKGIESYFRNSME